MFEIARGLDRIATCIEAQQNIESPENSPATLVQQLKDSISGLNNIRMALDCDPNIKENCYDESLNAVIAKLESV